MAQESGVSITTVSRILNGRASGVPIREQTRTRVMAVATELGYKPNLLARGLRGSRSSLLGVIARDISDPFHIQILRGINDAARAGDYRLFLGHVDYRPDVALTYGSMFERSHADGIIVLGDLEGGDATLDVFAQQHRFVVGITDRTTRRQIPGIYGDGVAGTELAMDHLWELGHRAIICVSDLQTYDGRLRIDLYERYMRRHGVPERIQVFTTNLQPEPSYEVGKGILERDRAQTFSAIYATSDTIAMGLMKAAFEAGVPIPDRLSIVGFDDIDFAAYTTPPLTTVSQSGVELGRIATEMLLDMIDHARSRADVSDVIMPPKLIVRRSTAAPAMSLAEA